MQHVIRTTDGQAEHYDAVYRGAAQGIPHWIRRDRRFELLGPVAGRRVLDLGSGAGEWALLLAEKGAQVVASDVSPESMRVVRGAARALGLAARVDTVLADAHRLPFEDASFDLLHGNLILHHLDLARAGPELVRVLKPGGVAVFKETCANNRLLIWARAHLVGRFGIPRWGVPNEYPMRRSDVAQLAAQFGHGSAHHFDFHCFEMVDAKLQGVLRGRRPLTWLDDRVYRALPALRPYSYHVWLRFERSAA